MFPDSKTRDLHCASNCCSHGRSPDRSGDEESWCIIDYDIDTYMSLNDGGINNLAFSLTSTTLDNCVLLDKSADIHREVDDVDLLKDLNSVAIRSRYAEIYCKQSRRIKTFQRLTWWLSPCLLRSKCL